MRDVSEVEKRWALYDRWGPHALMAVALLLAVVTADDLGMSRAARVATALLALAAVVLDLSLQRLTRGPSVAGACHYFTRWAIGFALTCLNPFFGVYAVHGYFSADRQLPRRLVMTGLYATAVVMALSNVGGPAQLRSWGPGWAVYAVLVCMHMGLVHLFAHLAAKEQAQAEAQAALITELERTNAALQQALDENAALHSQLVVQAREAGIADERRRLAAEIHDTIAQGLTGIIAQLQALETVHDPEVVRAHVARAARLARHSLGEARRSVRNLAPVDLEHDALPAALRRTVLDWSERTGVRADFTLTGASRELHGELAATLLRIAQEALSNAARHATPSRVGVTLSFIGHEVMLDIRDDGKGFDPRVPPPRTGSGGFGLDGMRARAERVAGSLTVESEPDLGTAVSARVPLVRHD